MTTSAISHRPAPILTIATAGFTGTLMAITLTSAEARPARDHSPSALDQTVHTSRDHVERGCFITPLRWNEALDGPLPRCNTLFP